MKIMKSFIICIIACAQLAHGEDITLVATTTQPYATALSEIVTLNQGETAKLIFANGGSSPSTLFLVCTVASKTFELHSFLFSTADGWNKINPIAIAGPATIVTRYAGAQEASAFATLSITRAGIASPPASIPQEAGTTWDVILESSSDLVNWTLANPGEYTGTGPKRFFRTRIVKKP
jgi:hypothetical protein